MFLQEVKNTRETLLRTAAEEVGYDVPLVSLGKRSNDILDAAADFVRYNYLNPGSISLERSGSYPYNLRQLADGEMYRTPHATPSKWWDSSPMAHCDRYGFGDIPAVKDQYEMDRYTRKLPRHTVRDFAMKLSFAIEYLHTLTLTVDGKFGNDPYKIAVARAALKQFGIVVA